MTTEYAIRIYEDYSIDKEKYVLYGMNRNDVQRAINNALENNYSFQVIVFNKEDK